MDSIETSGSPYETYVRLVMEGVTPKKPEQRPRSIRMAKENEGYEPQHSEAGARLAREQAVRDAPVQHLDGKAISLIRKGQPIFSGCMLYFPDALLAVAELSVAGNDKHNPGQPLHWSRGKSNDHGDCIVRHQLDVGKIDGEDGFYHEVKVAWRALAQLQTFIEERRAAEENA
jgi:hypothetical protein